MGRLLWDEMVMVGILNQGIFSGWRLESRFFYIIGGCILWHWVGASEFRLSGRFVFALGSREVGPVGFIKLHASPGLGWHAGALLFKEEYVLVVSKVSCSVRC